MTCSYRIITVLLAASLVLVACGGQSVVEDTTELTDEATTDTPEALSEEMVTEPARETSSSRTITHALGETVISGTPRRVVTLSYSELEVVLALGLQPVGTTVITLDSPFPPYLTDLTDGIEIVGTSVEPNLELVLQLNPDLIIGDSVFIEPIYEQLTEIAPTVATAGSGWKESRLLLIGEALNRTAEAEQVLADYDARIAELREVLEGSATDITVSVVAAFRGDELNVYLKQSPPGIVLEDAGFARPSSQDVSLVEGTHFFRISVERLPEIDSDALFVIIVDQELFETFESTAIWSQLDAVQQDRVYFVDRYPWAIWGPLAAHGIIDDLMFHLGTNLETDEADLEATEEAST